MNDFKKRMRSKGEEPDSAGGYTPKKSRGGSIKHNFANRGSGSIHKDKKEIMREHEEIVEQERRINENDRIKALEELHRKGDEAKKVVIMPKYKLDKRLHVHREHDHPPTAVFMGLGWDENETTMRKHYRQYYRDELENIKEIFPKPSPFNTFQIKRGQTRGLKKGGLMSIFKHQKLEESGQVSTENIVGYFKGIIEIEAKDDKEAYLIKKEKMINDLKTWVNEIAVLKTGRRFQVDTQLLASAMERRKFEVEMRKFDLDHLNISTHIANIESEEDLKMKLLAQTKCLIRLYMISAFDLSSRDNGSPSDPYLKISCNNKVYNERDNYQLDEPNPDFYKVYEFEGIFPGSSPIRIEAWDYDEIFGDDLIGTTILDLEDRYFSIEWDNLEEKPIEWRQIYHKSSSISQGVIKCWVEIHPLSIPADQITLWDITPQPPEEFEVRVCVFNAKDVKIMDLEGTSDVYFRGFFDTNEDIQETDTHYRNQDGKPDFQYRLIYRIKNNRKDYKFTL